MRWLLLVVVLAAGCTKGRASDMRSKSLPTAKERVDFFCEYTICPSRPLDVAFQSTVRDNGGLLPGSGDAELHAVVRIKPDDAPHWSRGCDSMRFHPRPPWADALFAELKTEPKTTPDIWGCPMSQRRVIHVRDGLVVLWMKSQ